MKAERYATASLAGLFWPAWGAFAIIVFLVNLLDVQTALSSLVARNVKPWETVVWEYTSGVAMVAFYPLIWRVAGWARPGDGRPARLVLAHGLASLAFSLLHIGGFLVLRHLIYALVGGRYHFGGLNRMLFEYPRDLIAYGLAASGLWGMSWLIDARSPTAATPLAPPVDANATFDIRDGARTLRVPLGDIAAVSSAGNYVEFSLVDCRKPLMRGTLGAMESQLASKGFVRIHRSWLVNAARVEAIEPAGSGDFTVSLAGGVKAPLSRRFREALDALRG